MHNQSISSVTSRSDTVKINQLFEKINSANNIEIEERSIKNIAQKVQLNLLSPTELAVNSSTQIGYLLQWINKRYSHATSACLLNNFTILAHVSTCEEGRIVLNELGALPFLTSVHQECEDLIQKEVIEKIIANLINTTTDPVDKSANPFQTFDGRNYQNDTWNQESIQKKHQTIQSSNYKLKQQELGETTNQKNNNLIQRTARADFTVFQSESSIQSHNVPTPTSGQNILHTAHMEILHKNQCLKEPCELPFITLSEHDEKLIFDLSVQLKFGDFRTVLITTQSLDLILQDFPVEVLLQRTDTIKALLDLLEGGLAGQSAFSNLAQHQLIILCRRLRQLYRFNTNNMTKKSAGSSQTHEYLQLSYPSCRDGVWNTLESVTEIKKYGAQLSSEKMATAALQGSLSCRSVLGLIITKSVYLLKDTEKIGLYIQLINEAWRSVQEVYRINGNSEFTEMLHLILFAFDSVCEFYRDQIFEEVLITPILDLILVFIKQLNYINQDQQDRYKNPFSETLFKNTEKLQMTLRRGLFILTFAEDQSKVILDFFQRIEHDLPQVNTLQRQVIQSYARAIDANQRFKKVHEYRLTTNGSITSNNFEDMCFVDSLPQLNAAIDILDTLSGCIEMKIDFPFEHLLLDCVVYSQLLIDQQPDNKVIDIVEKLFVTYLSLPLTEVRERVLRRMFQRVRIVSAFQQQSKYKVNNNYLLAKFCYRKRILNQLVNGLLINQEVANEMTKLQIDLGTVIIKTLIIAYTEAGLIQQKNSNLNSFLLTFQSLLPKYPDLLGLVDLIEENGQQNCRYLRLLRDIFNKNEKKREFATQILQKQISKDCQPLNDLLLQVIDVKDPSAELCGELDLVNLNYDFSSFDTINIQSILMNAKSDYSIRKSSLEQLTMLLFDQQKRGRALFVNKGVTDVFTFVVQEVLTAFKTTKTVLDEQVGELPADQQTYLEQCLRFLTISYIFYSEEPVIKSFFDNLKVFTNTKCADFENLLNACVFFSGSHLRKQAIRLLFFMIFDPVLLKIKTSKSAKSQKLVQMLIPDFCVETFLIIIPSAVQVVKQPMREDLLLSEEQKDFVYAMLAQSDKQAQSQAHISHVAKLFIETPNDNYQQLMQTYEQLQNYLLALSNASEHLLNIPVLQKFQELLRMLPTKDFEYNFLADFCMFTNQIMTVAENITNTKQIEALVQSFCLGLKFHLLPFLFEVNMSGIEQELNVQHSPRMIFIGQLLDLLLNLSKVDTMLRRKYRTQTNYPDAVLSSQLFNYLSDLHAILKDKQWLRHKILSVFAMIITNYETKNFKMDRVPDLFTSTIAQHRMSHSFQGNSLVMTSIRMLIHIYQSRQSHIEINQTKSDLDNHVSLSRTAGKAIQQFQSSGWITRFTESRDARLRCLTWDVLTEMFDYSFFKQNQSLVHQSISTLQREGELYCVKVAVLKFVNKLCDCMIHNVDAAQLNSDIQKIAEVQQEEITVKMLLETVSKQGFISQIHNILVQKDCPLLMISQLLKFLSSLVQMDFKRALPILTQLDYWTVLVDLINLEGLARQEEKDSRAVLIQLQQTVLHQNPPKNDLVYMCLNSVLEFIFQAMKQDSQLANLLVKTTKLMPALISTLKQTLTTVMQSDVSQAKIQGLVLIFIDKCVKLMHLALLHPREHTLTILHNLIDSPDEDQQYGWQLILSMFGLVGSKHSIYYYGHIDVKLALCRFVAEYLLRVQQTGLKTHIDNTIHKFDATIYMNSTTTEQDLSSYGGQLLLEFGKVFRALYVDQRDSRQQVGVPYDTNDYENSKIDICQCIQILCASSNAAKVQSIEQNLFKKVLEICEENVAALSLSELQKLASKNRSSTGSTKGLIDPSRRFKYAQLNDSEGCEREVIRMLSIFRHIIYGSGNLLQQHLFIQQNQSEESHIKSFVSQNALTKSAAQREVKKKEQSLGDRLVSLFGTTLEQITLVSVVEECLQTMVTMASQNKKFKSAFLVQSSSLVGSKRNTVMKIIVDAVQKETFSSNQKRMHLMFVFLKSTTLAADVVKEISKLRLVEEIQAALEPVCKNEKDVKLLKSYLVHYTGFLAAYAHSEEGARTIIQLKQVFTMSLFIIDTVTPPSGPEVTPLTQLTINILLFLRNSSMNRVGKQHFISDRAFLPCLMAFLSSRQQHARVRASTAACLWTVLFNHQGVKAALNSESVRSELQLLQNEYQRTCDISTYAAYIVEKADRGKGPSAFDIVDTSDDREISAIRKQEDFILLALNGILALLEA